MKTVQEELRSAQASGADFKRPTCPESKAREGLDWAIDASPIKVPPQLCNPYAWHWDADDLSLYVIADDGEYRFHVAEGRLGREIGVLSVTDNAGKVVWEGYIPDTNQEGQDDG